MNTRVLHGILRFDSKFLIFYLIIQAIFVFVVDFKIDLVAIPGVIYLEQNSLFPNQTYNSLTISLILGFFILLLNIPVGCKLISLLLEKRNDVLMGLNKSYQWIYWRGYGFLDIYGLLDRMRSKSKKFQLLVIFFVIYMIFLLCYWMFGWEFIDLPAPRLLVSLVSQFKVFLYLMSVLIFCSVGFLLISALSTVVLIIYSFCNKNFLQEK
jgi:hypothetical protein